MICGNIYLDYISIFLWPASVLLCEVDHVQWGVHSCLDWQLNIASTYPGAFRSVSQRYVRILTLALLSRCCHCGESFGNYLPTGWCLIETVYHLLAITSPPFNHQLHRSTPHTWSNILTFYRPLLLSVPYTPASILRMSRGLYFNSISPALSHSPLIPPSYSVLPRLSRVTHTESNTPGILTRSTSPNH